MAIWRSPLLYLGFAIIALTAAALAAPFLMDFNRWKPELEGWGARVTGRQVRIAGDVGVRLFPWPTLTLRRVSVSNPQGARQPDLLRAEEIRARLSLAALVSGRLEIEQVHLLRPVFSLERLKSGEGTWRIRPRAKVRLPFSPERIAVAGVTIEDGTVYLIDGRRGGVARVEKMDARVSAPALPGPWRFTAQALMQGRPVSITISTGKFRPGLPLPVSFRLAPKEGEGFLYTFDGQAGAPEAGRIRGRLRIRPLEAKKRRNGPRQGLSLFSLKADVLAGFDEIWLRNIEAAPLSAAHSANSIKGAAHIVLGSILEVEATLRAPRFDLDYALGADARARLFGASGLRWLSDIVSSVPEELLLRLDIGVTNLLAGKETLEELRLSLGAESDRLSVNAFSVTLPGRTTLAFSGQLLPDPQTPQLSGSAELRSASLRDFVLWALPEQAAAISRVWTGARGRLRLDAGLDVTPRSFRLLKGSYDLDDARGVLVATLETGAEGEGRLDLRVNADTLDIDRYIPPAGDRSGPAAGLTDLLTAAMGLGETSLGVSASRMNVRGLPLEDVAIRIIATPDLVEIRNFDIGSLKGVKMDMAGLLKFPDGGVEGSVDADITSPDGRPLWRLLAGLEGGRAQDPPWLGEIGGIDLKMRAAAKALETGAEIKLSLKGAAGPAQVEGGLSFTGAPAAWRKAMIDLSGRVRSPSSRALLALFGRMPPGGRDAPASLDITMKGRPQEGLKTTAALEMLGLETRFLGELRNVSPESGLAGEGKFAFRAADAPALLRLAGLAAPRPRQTLAYGEGDLAFSPGHLRYRNLKGAFAGTAFGGELALERAEEGARLSGRVHSALLDLPALTALWMTAPDGTRETGNLPDTAKGNPERFRAGLFSGGWRADLDWRAGKLLLLPGFALPEGRVGVRLAEREIRTQISAGNEAEGSVSATITAAPARAGVFFRGGTELSLPLEKWLRRKDGRPVISARMKAAASWSARARSLAGVMTAMNGKGRLSLSAGRVENASPRPFLKAVMKAKSAAEVEALARRLLHGGALPFPAAEGTLKITSGVLATEPFTFDAEGIRARMEAVSELAAGKVDISFVFRDRSRPAVPPFGFALAGSPRALHIVHDLAELKSWAAVMALRRSMDNLERVERQRRRILERDSAFERSQVMFNRWEDWTRRKAAEQAALRRRTERLLIEHEKRLRARAREKARERERKAARESALRDGSGEPAETKAASAPRRAPPARKDAEATEGATEENAPARTPPPVARPRPAQEGDGGPASLPAILRNLRKKPAPLRLTPPPPPRPVTNFRSSG